MTTPILGIDELVASQAQPHLTLNTAIRLLEAAASLSVTEQTNTPPVSPVEGDRYIVGLAPTGAWVAHENEVAYYSGGAWRYITPTPGLTALNQSLAAFVAYGLVSSPVAWDVLPIGPQTIGDLLDVDFPASPEPADGDQLFWNSTSNLWEVRTPTTSAGRHAVYVPAAGMSPSATGGCAALATIASAANQPDIQTLDFDASTQEFAQFSFRMPKSWDEGTVTFVPVWSHAATTTNFGVVWDLQAVAVSDDDAIAVAFGTAQTSADTGGTTNDVYMGPESAAITVGGTPQPEDMVFFRVSRVVGDGSDNMAIDARLHGITVYITTNAENDA